MGKVLAWALTASLLATGGALADPRPSPEAVLETRYALVLGLVRHTATYTPPVASRAFAYFGVIGYEAVASGRPAMRTLGGQLQGFSPPPPREPGAAYDDALVLDAALSAATAHFFDNTGPTGQRAMAALDAKFTPTLTADLPADVVSRSQAYGRRIAGFVAQWASGDGRDEIANMGFPLEYTFKDGPDHWRPTSAIAQQQAPLLPDWGQNRSFAVPSGATCDLPPPRTFSTAKDSDFYKDAQEVDETRAHLTPQQEAIARFWSDDPMLSTTPPGHWIQVSLKLSHDLALPIEKRVDLLARLGVATADAFISCWRTKFKYNLVRPYTYIRAHIDPGFEPLLITPPFPEYPSAHSTQSGAAAAVLTQAFGENFAYDDSAHERDGLPARHFASFRSAADEAAISRLYGGIHFRAAIERGLDQGRCVGAYATALKTQ